MGDPYLEQLAHIQGCFTAALNSGKPPSEVALSALQASFPSASICVEDGVITKRTGLGMAERTSLDDALHELALNLAQQAVASGKPLLEWLHPDAAPVCTTHTAGADRRKSAGAPGSGAVPTITRFLDTALCLAELTLAEPFGNADRLKRLFEYESLARLFEGLMEVGTTQDCATIFRYMEVHMPTFSSEVFIKDQQSKLTLLRTCNMVARRLSKAFDVQLCGRLLIFLSRVYGLNDKAGVNVQGAINTALPLPLDDVQPGDVDSIGEPIDRKLYTTFWGLQAVFQAPSQIFQPAVYAKVASDISQVLDEFKSIKNPVAAVGLTTMARPGAGSAASAGQGGAAPMDTEDVNGGATEGDGGDDDGEDSELCVRYLSSSKLFGLQLRDCTFRRHFLVQCLALLHYYDNPNKLDKPPSVRPDGLDTLTNRLYAALSDTKEHGPEFADAVRMVLSHETHWVAWKKAPGEACRDFSRPPLRPTSAVVAAKTAADAGPAPKRRRKADINRVMAVSRMVQALQDPMQGLKRSERMGPPPPPQYPGEPPKPPQPLLPTMRELLQRVVDDMDPEAGIEPDFRAVKQDGVFRWKASRMVARHALDVYTKAPDLEKAVQELYPDVKAMMTAHTTGQAGTPAAANAADGDADAAADDAADDAAQQQQEQANGGAGTDGAGGGDNDNGPSQSAPQDGGEDQGQQQGDGSGEQEADTKGGDAMDTTDANGGGGDGGDGNSDGTG